MSFKNAIKLVFSKFNMVWIKLALMLLATIVIASLCVDPVLDLYNWLGSVGFTEKTYSVWTAFTTTGNIATLFSSVLALLEDFLDFYISSPDILWQFTLKFGFLVLILYKFLLTSFEIATTKQIYGIMSDNSTPGFWVSYISQFGTSVLYSLVKTVTFFIYDAVTFVILYFSTLALTGYPFFMPVVASLIIILFLSLRSSFFYAWTAFMVVEKRNLFVALGKSIIAFFKNFSKVFSAFLIAWICIISLCIFVGTFTFGVALIMAVPASSVFLSFLNMTLFYSSNGMRYYMDDKIFDINYI